MTLKPTFAAALTAMAMSFGAPLAAQDQSTAQDDTMVEPAQIAAEDVTDKQVDAFVTALVAIEDIRAQYLPKLQAEEDEAAREKLAVEANEAALQAVTDVEGLSTAEYLGIGKAASENQELTARISEQMQEVQGTPEASEDSQAPDAAESDAPESEEMAPAE